jgi:hypothetical protein
MNTRTNLLITGLATLPGVALAHDGHGMPSAMHFHASDAWGFAMLAAVAVAVFFIAKKKK